jgi:hypothetical protein
MREQMPKCAEWVDAMRAAFGREFIDGRIRAGLKDGGAWFVEGDHYLGLPGQPERDARRAATEHRFNLDQLVTGSAASMAGCGQAKARP